MLVSEIHDKRLVVLGGDEDVGFVSKICELLNMHIETKGIVGELRPCLVKNPPFYSSKKSKNVDGKLTKHQRLEFE